MPKYYIMLVDRENHEMRVPVKALINPYDHQQPFYCAGMPQFFGGTDTDDQPPVTVMGQEVMQESRNTLELTSESPPHFLTEANMFFYWADETRWKPTGKPWRMAQNNTEAEMDRVITVGLLRFNNRMDDKAIVHELLNQTGSETAPGIRDFSISATCIAFIKLIRMYTVGDLTQ
jgi:hypothetical protein